MRANIASKFTLIAVTRRKPVGLPNMIHFVGNKIRDSNNTSIAVGSADYLPQSGVDVDYAHAYDMSNHDEADGIVVVTWVIVVTERCGDAPP